MAFVYMYMSNKLSFYADQCCNKAQDDRDMPARPGVFDRYALFVKNFRNKSTDMILKCFLLSRLMGTLKLHNMQVGAVELLKKKTKNQLQKAPKKKYFTVTSLELQLHLYLCYCITKTFLV